MSFVDQKSVLTCPCIVVWDAITKPEIKTREDGSRLESYYLTVAIDNAAPEYQELQQLFQNALKESKWQGVLPAGGNHPMKPADVAKLGPLVTNHSQFSAKTVGTPPDVFDINGKVLSPVEYGRKFYAGAKVKVLVHAYEYDNKQKGIGFGVEGVMIVDAEAPKLDVSGGRTTSEIAGIMSGQAAQQQPAYTPPPPAAGFAAAPPPPASAGPQMVPGCPYTYQQLVEAKYTDEMMRSAGYLI